MFDIPVAFQVAIVAAVLAGLAVWLKVLAHAERRTPRRRSR
jgi:hypothetical protein